MKSSVLALGAFSMLQLAVAQPHRGRRHVHDHLVKKDDVVVTVVDTVYAQATEVPEVIVWVDQNGVPVTTVTEGFVDIPASVYSSAPPTTLIPSTTAPVVAAAAVPSSSSSAVAAAAPAPVAPVAPAAENVEVAATTAAPAVVQQPTTAAAPAPSSTSSSSSTAPEGNGYGIAYSPYNMDHSCKTQDQVNTDFDTIGSQGFSMVRIYGTDCNQVTTVLNAAKNKGMKLFAGIYDLSDLSGDVQKITDAANGDWSHIDTVSVGNELVNDGAASASAVVAAIGTVRNMLTQKGYTGKVVTVDTLVAARANPSLCDASDYCAVNCHPFYDGNTAAAESGSFLQTMIPTLANVLANKNQEIVITETGWPWNGLTNGAAIPSLDNQAAALSSIKQAFTSTPSAVILFTAFNDMWKTSDPAQFQAEQYWGMGGVYSPSDPASAAFKNGVPA